MDYNVNYETLVQENKDCLFIDLRTTREYEEDHIPSALSFPIFTDTEYEAIGTMYKKDPLEAKLLGIQYVSAKLAVFLETIIRKSLDHHVVLYCSRGGYRSSIVTHLLFDLGFRIQRIKGGYKEYRAYVRESLAKEVEKIQLVTLYGCTGVGKTQILEELKNLGADILDLESYANHRGSALGSIGLGKSYGQKRFESLLLEALRHRKGDLLFTEGESMRIGRIALPKRLFEKMKEGRKVYVYASMDFRCDLLYKEYVKNSQMEEIKASMANLCSYVSDKKRDLYHSLLKEEKYKDLIKDLCISYYDPKYKYTPSEKDFLVTNTDTKKCAMEIFTGFCTPSEPSPEV